MSGEPGDVVGKRAGDVGGEEQGERDAGGGDAGAEAAARPEPVHAPLQSMARRAPTRDAPRGDGGDEVLRVRRRYQIGHETARDSTYRGFREARFVRIVHA